MEPRILAIDVRAQLLGFAVLEGPRSLLDWGRKPFRESSARDNAVIVRMKIVALLSFFAPSVVVLKYTSGRKDRELLKNRKVIEAIRHETKMQSVDLVFLTREDVRRAFRQSGNTSKYKIAGLIAEMFPELTWKLPPKRKNYYPEHHSMPIFDAISLGLTYFAQSKPLLGTDREQQEPQAMD